MLEGVGSNTDYISRNRVYWDGLSSAEGEHGAQYEYGRRQWSSQENWGDWSVPETELRLFPDTMRDADVIELGCGTAYISAWLKRRGALPVGIDVSSTQLDIARRLQVEFHLEFPLVRAASESVPYPDESFDLAISEYGASSWSVPDSWIREAARLLRPGGRLIFLTTSPIVAICMPTHGGPVSDRLARDYFGLQKMDRSDGTTQFELPYGEWINLLRLHGMEIERLIEIRPPEGSRSPWPEVSLDWARRWPSECVWDAKKRAL